MVEHLIVRGLSAHHAYACQHRGVCCSSDWPIPVEDDRLAMVRAAIVNGRLRQSRESGTTPPFVSPSDADGVTFLGRAPARCVFRITPVDADRSGHCAIHHALGHDALPRACQQFPRVTVIDPRGASVTLSHYCPTAHAMLLAAPRPFRVVVSPSTISYLDASEIGLDARDNLPPLLRPSMLMDWDSWWLCEALAVDLISRADGSPEVTLTRLATVIEDIRGWRPGDGALLDRVRSAFDRADFAPGAATVRLTPIERDAHVAEVLATIPDGIAVPHPSHLGITDDDINRLLAAHAFANWTVHLAGGLRTWLRSLDTVVALARTGYDLAQIDLLLRHLSNPRALALRWSEVER